MREMKLRGMLKDYKLILLASISFPTYGKYVNAMCVRIIFFLSFGLTSILLNPSAIY